MSEDSRRVHRLVRPLAMTPENPEWRKFCERLGGPEACDFKEDPFSWKCNGRTNRPFARKILRDMGANVAASLRYYDTHGGHCDCEILFNCDRDEGLTARTHAPKEAQ